MIIVGLTGGIASGKTTITNFLKKKKYPVHDSDDVVKKIYLKPSNAFLKYLKKINLENSIKGKKIDKKIIKDEIFNDIKKRKFLETHLHAKIKISRNVFLKKQKQKKTKIVFLDIPLLFENRLERFFDETICIISTKKNRLKRTEKNKKFTKKIFNKILRAQKKDKERRLLATHTINNNGTKKEFILKAKKIIERY